MSDTTTVILALVPTISATVAAIIGILNNAMGKRNAQEMSVQSGHIVESKDAIVQLGKNTDGIKDALVKTTGEAEFARGLKVGTDVVSDVRHNL